MHKILYVDKLIPGYFREEVKSDAKTIMQTVKNVLSKRFEVIEDFDFDSSKVDRLLKEKDFSALVTHFPFDSFDDPRYIRSSSTYLYLRKELPDFPVVIYTGGNIIRELPPSLIKTIIVEKSRNIEGDAMKILSHLEELIE